MPFWRHGFLLEPETSPTVLVQAVPHALGGPIGDDGVMHGLSAATTFDQLEFHFELALLVSIGVFNSELHGRLLFRGCGVCGALLGGSGLGLGGGGRALYGHNFA